MLTNFWISWHKFGARVFCLNMSRPSVLQCFLYYLAIKHLDTITYLYVTSIIIALKYISLSFNT